MLTLNKTVTLNIEVTSITHFMKAHKSTRTLYIFMDMLESIIKIINNAVISASFDRVDKKKIDSLTLRNGALVVIYLSAEQTRKCS